MSIEIKVPDIGTDEIEITEIMAKIGEKIEVGQPLIIAEGDKASMEIPSPQAGIVKEIKISVGDKIKTGTLIMIFDDIDKINPVASRLQKEKKNASNTITMKNVVMPNIGIDEVEVTEIMVKIGDKVEANQLLITVEKNNKFSMKIPAPFSGTVREIKININEKISTGSLIMVLEVTNIIPIQTVDSEIKHNESNDAKEYEHFKENEYDDNIIYATPLIRRMAREFGVNLAKVKGTGRKGRILREDIYCYVKNAIKHSSKISSPTTGNSYNQIPETLPWPKIDFSNFGEIEKIELGRIQKISSMNLSRNWVMIPHVTHFDKIDITELEKFRKQQNIESEKRNLDVKFTPIVFLVKAVATALEQMPRFNSSLLEDGRHLILKKYINIGIAVDTQKGLVVPVLRDVNKKSITTLARELIHIIQKARSGNLATSEMQGGCFTISSIGGLGTTNFAPIVNAPEVAIIGVSKFSTEPVWNNKEFVPRLMMPISLSFDHRVIDGADGARFITLINNMLSDIRRLIM